ncbi:MAG TPA: (E)-4-hydroxy-3-methylbut-2-enyl-diphosphate synthase [Bacteroidales bacterium]|nr:(E)-4-hydroxy-3-methylbut-2-enyl-diphosphate synthase [Bacteroidales bacterium]
MKSENRYCNNLISYARFKTRVVHIGDIPLGGHHPIRIQSMTNTNTMDTTATVNQTIRLVDAGCDYVRITAQGPKEAENLAKIKKELSEKGYTVPLIADIHFNPLAAEIAARIVEKVRINPGNYVDKKKNEKIDYSDFEYQEELEHIKERISPLIKICKENNTAIRIGTNHGSLSDRIMSRYGDTPLGMVESALEFIQICEFLDFRNIVLSMKASNIKIMVEAYRLLVHRMMKNGMDYPLHVGVTEAGSGMEGRIKSAAGIGALLHDGIGDTIRVSLTENPEAEVPVAKTIANRYSINYFASNNQMEESPINPFEYYKRFTHQIKNIGKNNPPVIISAIQTDKSSENIDFIYTPNLSVVNTKTTAPVIIPLHQWVKKDSLFPLFRMEEYLLTKKKSSELNFILLSNTNLTPDFISKIKEDEHIVLIIESDNIYDLRKIFFQLIQLHCKCPVIIKRTYTDLSEEEFMIYAASDIAFLMVDGLGDGIWLEAEQINTNLIEKTASDILQSIGSKIYKTEYISCPTCGRTSYNILETIDRIKQYTGHLKGLKIAIMGCVVNGPGEMADADYGYVGSLPGKINLYKNKTLVRRNINENEALDALIQLIKDNGDWIDEA